MISFLVDEKHLSRDEAYMLTNVAVDVDITPARGWKWRGFCSLSEEHLQVSREKPS
jgi:acetamidase/formamidase